MADCHGYVAPKTTTTATPTAAATATAAAPTTDHDDDAVLLELLQLRLALELRRPGDRAGARAPRRDHAQAARECPWDREQDERTIVPHTLEEAYELADAAHQRDDRKLLDELGDVLFQVHFLALLLEERGAGDLAQVAAASPRS